LQVRWRRESPKKMSALTRRKCSRNMSKADTLFRRSAVHFRPRQKKYQPKLTEWERSTGVVEDIMDGEVHVRYRKEAP
jgi:hypothetical protein